MTMSDRLLMDPMTAKELEAFVAYSRQGYIDDRVTNGGEDRRDATEVATKQYAEFVPDGKPAEGHSLFTGRDATTGETIGILWLFERTSAGGTTVFVYDVEVQQDRRGQGWGRELMAYGERWACERGAHEIALNVFGGNAVARGLYASLGYNERAVAMAKPLESLLSRTSPTSPTSPIPVPL
jgi:GNAT superfamily N-acetyltransferase